MIKSLQQLSNNQPKPASTNIIQLNPLTHSQMNLLQHPARFKIAACGRRWGKTELGKTALILQAVNHNQRCLWVAPTLDMLEHVWREVRDALKPLNGAKISASNRRIDLPNGGTIAFRSAYYPDRLRGQGYDFVVLDEAAYLKPRAWIEVIRPMLVTTRGHALFLSTPRGRNWFYDLYCLGLDPEENEWQSFHAPTADNELIHPDELASLRRHTPDLVWQTEYQAQFINAESAVFRGLEDAAAPAPCDQPLPGHAYIAGIDWGRSNDYTAIAVLDSATGKMVALDRFKDASWNLQRKRLQSIVQHWQPNIVWAEANSIGEPNIEALIQAGLPVKPFYTTAKSKAPLIESLALAIERNEITLLNDPILLNEFSQYSLEQLPNGSYRYAAPPGNHDDTVIATALAWHGSRFSSPSISFA